MTWRAFSPAEVALLDIYAHAIGERPEAQSHRKGMHKGDGAAQARRRDAAAAEVAVADALGVPHHLDVDQWFAGVDVPPRTEVRHGNWAYPDGLFLYGPDLDAPSPDTVWAYVGTCTFPQVQIYGWISSAEIFREGAASALERYRHPDRRIRERFAGRCLNVPLGELHPMETHPDAPAETGEVDELIELLQVPIAESLAEQERHTRAMDARYDRAIAVLDALFALPEERQTAWRRKRAAEQVRAILEGRDRCRS